MPVDLASLSESWGQVEGSLVTDFDDITFDHFFDSPSGSITRRPMPSIAASALHQRRTDMGVPDVNTPRRWVGWSWTPPRDAFGSDTPVVRPGQMPPRSRSLLVTPARHSPLTTGAAGLRHDHSAMHAIPRSIPRTRPISDRRAFQELLCCVNMSARKRARLIGEQVSLPQSWADGFSRNFIPPTPTPSSRSIREARRKTSTPRKRYREGGEGIQSGVPRDVCQTEQDWTVIDLETWFQSIEAGYKVCVSLEYRKAGSVDLMILGPRRTIIRSCGDLSDVKCKIHCLHFPCTCFNRVDPHLLVTNIVDRSRRSCFLSDDFSVRQKYNN